MFVDQVTIEVESGKGGNGAATFRREKYVPKGGPDGGNGGKGGDVILRANVQLHTLLDQRYKRHYKAQNGVRGEAGLKDGKWGENEIVQVPCGTVVRDAETGELVADLTDDKQEIVVAEGGRGGRGNNEFKSATNQAPRKAESGKPGVHRTLSLELKLIADIGLVGFPNAGKSTLIATITAAKPKIADYPFTTLEPNLGIVRYRDYRSFTVADIPGLIEGAHEGKGLGIQFLKHIERTRALVILIESFSEDYEQDFATLRSELSAYSKELSRKPFIVAISKSDIIDDAIQSRIDSFRESVTFDVHVFSSVSNKGVDTLTDAMWSLISADQG